MAIMIGPTSITEVNVGEPSKLYPVIQGVIYAVNPIHVVPLLDLGFHKATAAEVTALVNADTVGQ